MNILILGASGLLGSNLFNELKINHNVIGTTSHYPDFKDLISTGIDIEIIRDICHKNKISLVINCVAITDIEYCENHPEAAWIVNSDFPYRIGELTRSMGIKFVHISTDHFITPFGDIRNEKTEAQVINQYSYTKLSSEKLILNCAPETLILRVSFIGTNRFGFFDKSLFSFMYNNLKSSKEFIGFEDITFNPVSAGYIADTILNLIESDVKGILNVGSSDSINKFEFAQKLASKLGCNKNLVKRGVSADKSDLVARPRELTLDITHLSIYCESQSVDLAIDQTLKSVTKLNDRKVS